MSDSITRARGIRRHLQGWQVIARVKGRYLSKKYPLDTTLEQLMQHRQAMIVKAQHAPVTPTILPPRVRSAPSTLAEDAAAYLQLITAMPTYDDIAYHIGQWVERLGTRPRASLTSRDMREQLEYWRRQGRADGQGGLSNGSLNKRRTALMALYTTLDGRSAVNIVKDVPRYDERGSLQIRDQPLDVIARVIRQTTPRTKTRARLRVLQWTGWPAQLVMEITPDDVDWAAGTVRAHRRKKGRGMPETWVPVVPRALIALRQFFALGAQGRFSTSAMHARFADALALEQQRRVRLRLPRLPHMHPYMLKHSFGTWAATIIKDDRALKEMLRTNSIERYIVGANAARMEEARQQLTQVARARFAGAVRAPSGVACNFAAEDSAKKAAS
jgi:integrase